MAEIDKLEITLKSNAKEVANDFDKLSNSVDKTSKALTGMDSKSFNDLAKGVKSIAGSSSKTDKLDESLGRIATSLNKFASSINQIDTSKFDQISAKLDKIAEIGSKKIEAAAKSIRSLDKTASDTSGAKKGKQSYDEFMQSIKGLGSDRNFYGNLQQIGAEIERTRNKIEKINSAIEKYNAEGRSVETKGWRSAQMQLEQYSNYLDNLISKQKEMSTPASENIGLDINFAPNFEDRLYQMSDEVQKWYSEVEATIRNMGEPAINEGYFEKLKDIVIQPNIDEEQILDQMDSIWLELNQKFKAEPLKPQMQIDLDEFMNRAETESRKINDRLKSEFTITPTILGGNQRYSDEYTQLEKQIQKAQIQLEKFVATQNRLDQLGVKKSSQRYKGVELRIDEADKKLQQLYSDMQNLQASGRDIVDVSQFEILSERASKAQSVITSLSQAMRAIGLRSTATSLQSIGSEVGSLSTGLASTAEAAEGAGAAMAGLQTAIPVIGLIVAGVALLAKAFASVVKTITSAVKKIGNGVKTVASKIKDVAKNILSVGSSTGRSSSAVGRFINRLVGLFKSRVLRAAISQVYSNITEGFKILDNYSARIGSDYHNNFSLLVADLKVLGRSIAAAFEPILNIATPILDSLINKITTVINYINQFFSALSGSDTWTRATLTADDYSDAVGGATKAQKELNKSIREWDKLNVITDPNKNSGGGGGGSSSGGGGGFTTEDVESPIKNLAKRIKETWEKDADFTWLGEDIGNKVKEKLDGIQWEEKIKPAAAKFGEALATTINGFVEVPGLADTIGNTIAEAINTVLTGFESFTKNIHGDSIGTFIGELVGTALDDIEWDKYIHGMGKLGEELAKGVNALAETDVLSSISRAFANILKGAIEGAYQFVTGVKWGNLGKKIGDSINEFFKKMNEVDEDGMTGFQKAGATANSLANGLVDMVTQAVEDTDWSAVGNAIGDFLGEIDFVEIIKKLVKMKDSIRDGIKEIFTSATKDITWTDIVSGIVQLLGEVDWSAFSLESISAKATTFIFQAISLGIQGLVGLGAGIAEILSDWFDEIGADGAAGFFKGIADAFSDIGAWVSETFQTIITAIKEFFGIHSPSTVMAEIGGFLIEGLWEGIKTAVSSAGTWIKENVIDKITEAFGDAKEWLPNIPKKIEELWTSATTWLKDKALEFAIKIPDFVETVKTKVGEIRTWVSQNVIEIGADLKENIGEKIDNLKKKWEKVKFKKKKLTAKVKGGAIDAIKKVKTAWSNLKAGKKAFTVGLKGKALSALEKLKKIWDGLTEKAKDLSVTFNDTVSGRIKDMWNGVANMINKAIEKINKIPGVNISRVPTFKNGGFVGKRYATGGFPEDGWFRASQGEYFGKFDNGQQYIASNRQIENGLMNTVRAGNADVAVLMSQTLEETKRQNALLQQILAKENNISYQDVFKATQKGAKEYKGRTGRPAFV